MINWTVRFKNKTWVAAMLGAVIAFVYQILSLFEIVPAVSQDQIVQIVAIVLNILVAFGVVQDPTTAGLGDSVRALGYVEPNKG